MLTEQMTKAVKLVETVESLRMAVTNLELRVKELEVESGEERKRLTAAVEGAGKAKEHRTEMEVILGKMAEEERNKNVNVTNRCESDDF
jgi:hypothetical protein